MEKKPPLAQGQKLRLTVGGLGSSGEGIGSFEGFKVFVPFALPNEEVVCEIETVKKNYALARLLKIEEAAPDRREPLCPVYGLCGGCSLQHLSYEGQLEAKRQQVEAAFARLGHLTVQAEPTIACDDPWHYRNKMLFPAGEREGSLAIGCYQRGTHLVVDGAGCLIAERGNEEVLGAVRRWMELYNIPAYDEASGRGLIRHVMARCGRGEDDAGEVLAVLVTATSFLPREKELAEMLQKAVPHLVGAVQNINEARGNVILGRRQRLLWGKDSLTDRLGSLRFKISPASFFQVNRAQAEKLYALTAELAAPRPGSTVWDLYCGTGTISLYLAKKGAKVHGIEAVAAAIEDAERNAAANGCAAARFYCGDSAIEAPKLLAQGERPEAVVLDPPRAGCSPRVLATVVKAGPQRIVYVSCNPATLARDAALLSEQGYKLQKVQPLDMFPQTAHVETVALFLKQ